MEELQVEWLQDIDIYHRMVKLIGSYNKDYDYVGPEDWRRKLVSRHIYGIDMNVCAYIHDYRYELGGNEFNRLQADLLFFGNMTKWVEEKLYPWGTNWIIKIMAGRMVYNYFKFVRTFGKSSFNYK